MVSASRRYFMSIPLRFMAAVTTSSISLHCRQSSNLGVWIKESKGMNSKISWSIVPDAVPPGSSPSAGVMATVARPGSRRNSARSNGSISSLQARFIREYGRDLIPGVLSPETGEVPRALAILQERLRRLPRAKVASRPSRVVRFIANRAIPKWDDFEQMLVRCSYQFIFQHEQPLVDVTVAAVPPIAPGFGRDERQVQPCLGASEGHIVEPLFLPLAILFRRDLGTLVIADIQNSPLVFVILMKPVRAKPSETAVDKNDGRFEALALVDRHDLDCRAVAVEALHVAVLTGGLARFLDISIERCDQIGQRRSQRFGRLRAGSRKGAGNSSAPAHRP